VLKDFLHQDPVSAAAFSPDGRSLATGGSGATIRIWNASGKFEQRFTLAHPASADLATFSNTGRLLASGCVDGGARLWDVVSGKQIGPPLFHDLAHSTNPDRWVAGQLRSVEFAPDDTQILTAGADSSVRIWPVPKPRAGTIEEIISLIEALTVMELDPAGAQGDLDLSSWQQRRFQLRGLR
jgi:WD40 repeat protein